MTAGRFITKMRVFSCMGNSCGNLREYMELFDKYPQYSGGFLWDYIDQALYQTGPNGKEYLAYGAILEIARPIIILREWCNLRGSDHLSEDAGGVVSVSAL